MIVAQAEATFIVMLVAPLVVVKYTLSPATGAEAPEDPPSVADQFVVLFQFPVPPPTRYLSSGVTLILTS